MLSCYGITRDISVNGVFVLNQSSPPVGTLIELKIAVPNLSRTARGLHLAARGTVVRIERDGDYASRGFAAAVRFKPILGEEAGKPDLAQVAQLVETPN